MADDDARDDLTARPLRVERGDDIALTMELHNPTARAAHYIADVRGIAFDAATGRVEVLLSDEGRVLVPGGVFMEPRFQRVDPGADAELTVRIPRSIVRMAATDPPSAEVRFEQFDIGPDTEITVSVGWNDTPFYPDPRQPDAAHRETTMQEWEQHRLRVTFRPEPED